jgi:hypothetical protein
MPDLNRPLHDNLHAAASRLAIPGGDVRAVMSRGRARRRHQRWTGAVALAAAAGTIAGVTLSRSQPAHPINVTSGNLPPSAQAPTQLSWHATKATSGLAYVTSLSGGSVPYALSTAPGTTAANAPAPATLYRSSDGVSWTQAAGPPGVSLGDVSAGAGRLYAVGTGTATAGAGTLSGGVAVAWSASGTGAWHRVGLPLDLTAPRPGLTVADAVMKVAAGPRGVVAVVGLSATLQLPSLLPSGVTAERWTATTTGVELLGAERASVCGPGEHLTPSTPPASKIPPAAGAAKAQLQARMKQLQAKGSQPVVGQVTSVPCYAGDSVSHVLAPDAAYAVTGSYTWSQLGIGAQGAAAVLGEPLAFYSADGSAFHPVSLPTSIQSYSLGLSAGSNGFLLTAVGSALSPTTPVVLQSSDGRAWSSAPGLPAGTDQVVTSGFLAGSAAVITDGGAGPQALVLAGDRWDATDLGKLMAPAARGTHTRIDQAAFGPLGVAVAGGSDQVPLQVLYSPDGSRWSVQSLATLAGGATGDVPNVTVGSSSVVVTVNQHSGDPSKPAPQVAIVGSLPTPGAG